MTGVLRLVVPKGSLEKATFELFEAADLPIRRSSSVDYKATIDANTLSTRSMDRLAKVARTAADLAESDTTEPEHIDAAARFVIGGTLRENF